MADDVRWKWENDTDLTRKKCTSCHESMMLDRASAVSYQGETYHAHCLITLLTNFHYKNYAPLIDKSSDCADGQPNWGFSP